MSRELIHPEQFAHISSKVLSDTAVTSTPEQEQEVADLFASSFGEFRPGAIVNGKVIHVDNDGVLVDIGYKSRGFIPRYEFGPHGPKNIKEGQEIEVLVETLENIDGSVSLSYEQAKSMRAWDTIVKLFEEGKPVEGKVTHKVKGGLSVDIGIPAFLPGSQIDLQRVTDFDQYLDQNITANILKINRKRGNIIISRRKYLSTQRSDSRRKILDTLQEGQVIQGIVKNITNYGVFVDIGGVDGLLHIIDMTWGRIAHPSEMVKIGDSITVKVLSFDKESEKISLGLKQLSDNPWEGIEEKIKAGSKIKGKVASITDYGLFIEVAPGIEGLVHISEISWTDRINNLHNKYHVGQEIEVYVVSVDKGHRRMSLSIKQLEKSPWETINEEFKVGQKVTGKISNIVDFGIFVQLLPGIDGLVRISDLSWTEHVEHPSDRYKIGQEVEAVVLSIDKEHKRISLGIKQLETDPWNTVDQDYSVNSIIDGEISKITNFGAFVRLPSGIEGLIHNTTLQDEQGGKADEVLKVGQKGQFRVASINKDEHKLGLSTRLEGPQPKPAATERKQRERSSSKQESTSRPPQTDSSLSSRMKGTLQIALEEALNKGDDKNESSDE